MAAKIDIQISEQNFELIRDRIGAILLTELLNQTYAVNAGIDKVWINRFIPWDSGELPAISVNFDKATYTDRTSTERVADANEYIIDVVTRSDHSETESGDSLSKNIAERLAGIVMYILSDSHYITLSYDTGFIGATWVDDLQMGLENNNQESNHTVVARITFKVKAIETSADIQPTELEEYTTTTKLNETEKGQFLSFEATEATG